MKATGIVRKLDSLGRIVVPKELRRRLDIEHKDALEIFVDHDQIVLKKYEPNNTCVITGEISEKNMQLANSELVVSPEGAKQLLKQLQDYVDQQDNK
jgi:transcriptional pleiotropic regulator of transition state genes